MWCNMYRTVGIKFSGFSFLNAYLYIQLDKLCDKLMHVGSFESCFPPNQLSKFLTAPKPRCRKWFKCHAHFHLNDLIQKMRAHYITNARSVGQERGHKAWHRRGGLRESIDGRFLRLFYLQPSPIWEFKLLPDPCLSEIHLVWKYF